MKMEYVSCKQPQSARLYNIAKTFFLFTEQAFPFNILAGFTSFLEVSVTSPLIPMGFRLVY